MKIFKRALLIFIILIGLLLAAAAIFVATFDVNRFKPQIIAQATNALKRDVALGKISLSLSATQGIRIEVRDISVKDDPAFSDGVFLSTQRAVIGIDVPSLLFKKQLHIHRIDLLDLACTIIRQKDGSVNVQTLARSPETSQDNPSPQRAPDTPGKKTGMLPFSIALFHMGNGTITCIDRTSTPEAVYEINRVNITLERVLLTQSFPFRIEAALLNDSTNVTATGHARLDLQTSQVQANDIKISLKLTDMTAEKLRTALPVPDGVFLPESLEGLIDISIERLVAGASGLTDISAAGRLSEGSLAFKEIPSPITDINAALAVTSSTITFSDIIGHINKGTIAGQIVINDYMDRQDLTGNVAIENLDIKDLVPQHTQGVTAEGLINGKIDVQAQGLNPDTLRTTLTGKGRIDVTQAKIVNLNVLETVLSKFSMLPGLTKQMADTLPPKYKMRLLEDDTPLQAVTSPITIAGGQISLDPIDIQAEEFTISGKAQADFSRNFSVEGTLLIPRDLSGAMVVGAPELKYLANENREIFFPMKVTGTFPQMQISPDLAYISERLLVNQGKQQLIRVIDKALGGKGKESSGDMPAGEQDRTIGETIVGDIFGNFLK